MDVLPRVRLIAVAALGTLLLGFMITAASARARPQPKPADATTNRPELGPGARGSRRHTAAGARGRRPGGEQRPPGAQTPAGEFRGRTSRVARPARRARKHRRVRETRDAAAPRARRAEVHDDGSPHPTFKQPAAEAAVSEQTETAQAGASAPVVPAEPEPQSAPAGSPRPSAYTAAESVQDGAPSGPPATKVAPSMVSHERGPAGRRPDQTIGVPIAAEPGDAAGGLSPAQPAATPEGPAGVHASADRERRARTRGPSRPGPAPNPTHGPFAGLGGASAASPAGSAGAPQAALACAPLLTRVGFWSRVVPRLGNLRSSLFVALPERPG